VTQRLSVCVLAELVEMGQKFGKIHVFRKRFGRAMEETGIEQTFSGTKWPARVSPPFGTTLAKLVMKGL
jgi:hypothetical protein